MILPIMSFLNQIRLARLAVRLAVVFALGLAVGAPASAGPATEQHPVTARLVLGLAATAPGATLWVDLHLDIAPGWHTYWRNPGDSGLPTEIAWSLPPGFSAGDISWPVPERFVSNGIGNYGYSRTVDLLVPITAPQQPTPSGEARLEATASWLVCSEICIPGEAKLNLMLPVAAAPAPPDPTTAALFAAARSRVPKPAGFAAQFRVSEKQIRVHVPAEATAGADANTASFFPLDPNIVDVGGEPKIERRGGAVDILLPKASGPSAVAPGQKLAGVLAVHATDGSERAYAIEARQLAAAPVEDEAALPWWQALLFALLGGIALNLMPCVFPVLSLKLVGLAGRGSEREHRHQGIAYALGVILSFAALGGALLALRAGGAAIGWGFQLQS